MSGGPIIQMNMISSLKSILLACIQREEAKTISKKLCDTVSELASGILPDGGWPELLPFMFQCVSSDSPKLQESAFLIFAQLSQYIGETLIPHIKHLHSCLSNSSDRDRFQDLLLPMMRTLTETLNSGQEATAQEALELLIELAGAEPTFFEKAIAIEFVITLAEARERAPGMMRKFPQFISRLFAILMKMLLDVEDDPLWHTAEAEIEDASELSNYSVGQECLDRLSISLGGNTIVPVASEFLPAYLAAPEWQKHHAALIALAQIAEGCSKTAFEKPHGSYQFLPACHLDSHNFATQVPVTRTVLGKFEAHAASAVLNFSENCTPDILTPYLDGTVGKLLVLLQTSKQMVQEGALTALASVADSSQEHFQKYYDAVMPCLKTILMNANDGSSRMLRAKAMECISLIGMAVGKEKFRDDAKQVMEVLMSFQGSHMEADDPMTSYMLQAWARLCKCLGQDFLPYMSVVMPPLLQSAQLKPNVTITSADSDNEIEESDDDGYTLSMETITLGDKRIGSVLEEKATACNMLCCYADELKEGFYSWIDQVAPTLIPLLKFYFHEEVRKAAVSAMPELLRSAKLAVEKGLAQGRNESYIKQLSDYIIPALVEALHKEPDTEICANMLDALNECIQLTCLPIKGDLIEAKVVHDQLCSMVEMSDRELLGPNNQYLPKIVSVYAEVLCSGKDLATEQTASRMINLLRQLQQTLPPSTLASTWSSLQPQLRLALQSILSS
ncbi:Importin repeat 4 [Dillenia turbinata]|uniref:Importin repeat 4 n=1 Tax=Dillenia turbinata TaxID=194707 RepID=A0AAN8UZC9_9MAGN